MLSIQRLAPIYHCLVQKITARAAVCDSTNQMHPAMLLPRPDLDIYVVYVVHAGTCHVSLPTPRVPGFFVMLCNTIFTLASSRQLQDEKASVWLMELRKTIHPSSMDESHEAERELYSITRGRNIIFKISELQAATDQPKRRRNDKTSITTRAPPSTNNAERSQDLCQQRELLAILPQGCQSYG